MGFNQLNNHNEIASNEPQLTAEVIKDWLAEDLKEKS